MYILTQAFSVLVNAEQSPSAAAFVSCTRPLFNSSIIPQALSNKELSGTLLLSQDDISVNEEEEEDMLASLLSSPPPSSTRGANSADPSKAEKWYSLFILCDTMQFASRLNIPALFASFFRDRVLTPLLTKTQYFSSTLQEVNFSLTEYSTECPVDFFKDFAKIRTLTKVRFAGFADIEDIIALTTIPNLEVLELPNDLNSGFAGDVFDFLRNDDDDEDGGGPHIFHRLRELSVADFDDVGMFVKCCPRLTKLTIVNTDSLDVKDLAKNAPNLASLEIRGYPSTTLMNAGSSLRRFEHLQSLKLSKCEDVPFAMFEDGGFADFFHPSCRGTIREIELVNCCFSDSDDMYGDDDDDFDDDDDIYGGYGDDDDDDDDDEYTMSRSKKSNKTKNSNTNNNNSKNSNKNMYIERFILVGPQLDHDGLKESNIIPSVLSSLRSSASTLRSFTLSGINVIPSQMERQLTTTNKGKKNATRFPSLEALDISGRPYVKKKGGKSKSNAVKQNPQDSPYVTLFSECFPFLKSLRMNDTAVVDSDLQSLSYLSGTLTELYLNNCDKLTDAGLAHLSYLTKLKHLNISGVSRITGLDFLEKLENALETLEVGPCTNFKSPNCLRFFSKNPDSFPNLTRIGIDECAGYEESGKDVSKIPPAAFAHLAANNNLRKNLTSLILYNGKPLKYSLMKHVVQLTGLKKLGNTGLKFADDDGENKEWTAERTRQFTKERLTRIDAADFDDK